MSWHRYFCESCGTWVFKASPPAKCIAATRNGQPCNGRMMAEPDLPREVYERWLAERARAVGEPEYVI